MKRTDAAYWAGIFDGEGCILMKKQSPPSYKGRSRFVVKVAISNINEWLLNSCYFAFGGRIRKQPLKSKSHRQCFQWETSARGAKEFLETIYPYLTIKKPQADIALGFLKRSAQKISYRLDNKEIAVREAEVILLRKLKRGDADAA